MVPSLLNTFLGNPVSVRVSVSINHHCACSIRIWGHPSCQVPRGQDCHKGKSGHSNDLRSAESWMAPKLQKRIQHSSHFTVSVRPPVRAKWRTALRAKSIGIKRRAGNSDTSPIKMKATGSSSILVPTLDQYGGLREPAT